MNVRVFARRANATSTSKTTPLGLSPNAGPEENSHDHGEAKGARGGSIADLEASERDYRIGSPKQLGQLVDDARARERQRDGQQARGAEVLGEFLYSEAQQCAYLPQPATISARSRHKAGGWAPP